MLFSCVIFSFFFCEKKMGRKKNGKKVGKFSKIFLLLQKRKEGEEEKASSLLSFELNTHSLTHSLAHYYVFLVYVLCFFLPTRDDPRL